MVGVQSEILVHLSRLFAKAFQGSLGNEYSFSKDVHWLMKWMWMVERKLKPREEFHLPASKQICCYAAGCLYKDWGQVLPYLPKSRADNISTSLNISSTIFNGMDSCFRPFLLKDNDCKHKNTITTWCSEQGQEIHRRTEVTDDKTDCKWLTCFAPK